MLENLGGPYLPAVGPVAALSEEDRGTLSSYGDFHLANQGDILISQGESHGRLFFVISGVLHAVRRDGDREVLLGAVRMGEWVGEVDLFDPMSAMCSVIVIEQAQVPGPSTARIWKSSSTITRRLASNSLSAWLHFSAGA